MRLDPEEYRRGILFWSIDARATLRTSTSELPGEQAVWSEPLTDPTGSKVQSPPHRYIALSVDVDDRTALRRPFQVRWERQVDGVVVTKIWGDSLDREPITLRHIPNYGKFHRLVVAAQYLGWADDTILRVGDVLIRLVEGKVTGESVQPMDQVETEGDRISITGGGFGAAEAEGRFVEIVAPGDSPDSAERSAYTILGLIALCMGDHAVGDVIFSEAYEASQAGQFGRLRIPHTAKVPRRAEDVELDTMHEALPFLSVSQRTNRAVALALRWYERGIRAVTPLDSLLSYFIGIETLVTAYAADHGPVPAQFEREQRYNELLERLAQETDSTTFSRVRQRLVEATLTERFLFYAAQHGLDDAAVVQFRHSVEKRNDILHGNPVDVGGDHARETKAVLVRMLKSELGLPEMPWEQLPDVYAITVTYKLLL